jgi:hypothetical protein
MHITMKFSTIFLFNFFGPVLKPVKTSPSLKFQLSSFYPNGLRIILISESEETEKFTLEIVY